MVSIERFINLCKFPTFKNPIIKEPMKTPGTSWQYGIQGGPSIVPPCYVVISSPVFKNISRLTNKKRRNILLTTSTEKKKHFVTTSTEKKKLFANNVNRKEETFR